MNEPIPATDGLKIPFAGSVMPVPDHVPPALAPVRVMGPLETQRELTGSIDASAKLVTIISIDEVSEHAPVVVYVIVCVNALVIYMCV